MTRTLKQLVQLEELAMTMLGLYGLYHFHAAWWWYLLLLFGPDISMLGYLGGNKTGAFCYNLFHHKAVGVIIFMAGWMSGAITLQLAGIIIFGHSALDRMLGYGLKTSQGFNYTHLGIIGKHNERTEE